MGSEQMKKFKLIQVLRDTAQLSKLDIISINHYRQDSNDIYEELYAIKISP